MGKLESSKASWDYKDLSIIFAHLSNEGMFTMDKTAADGASLLLHPLFSTLALCVTSESYS